MKRTFLAILLFLFGLKGSQAQEATRIPRLGILIPESLRPESQAIKGLRDGLKELGYKERKNILIEIRNAKGDRGALKQEANELIRQKVQLIFTTGTRATQAAMAATKEIPIIFRHSADPVALKFVKSMKQPGGNVTGVTSLSLQNTEKRLEIFKEIIPKLQRVLIFYDSNNPFSRESFAVAKKAAAKVGLDVQEYQVKTQDDLKNSLNQLQKKDGDGIFHFSDDLVESQADLVFDMARQKGLPTMFDGADWAIKGSMISYGANYYQMGRQAAALADRILKGGKPMKLPVERAQKYDLLISLRMANAIGLSIPPEVLKKADKVIR